MAATVKLGPNDLVACPSESSRRRHLARAEACAVCDAEGIRPARDSDTAGADQLAISARLRLVAARLPRGAGGPKLDHRTVRLLRIERGLSQAELGRLSGIGQSNLGRIESGQVRYPTARVTKALADGLGVSVWDLFASETVEELVR